MFDSYRDLFINSNSLRYKALREDFDLSSPMKAGRALELSKIQAKELENLHQTVNAVKCNRKELQHISKGNSAINKIAKSHALATSHTIAATPEKKNGKCRNCSGPYPHKDSCPAKNKECKSCGKLNHFARVCRKPFESPNPPESAKHVTFEDTAENDEYVYTIGGDKQPT